MKGCVCTVVNMWEGQRTICISLFSPSTIWVPEIELRSSALAASTFTLRAISLAQCMFLVICLI